MGLHWKAKIYLVFCLFNVSRHWQKEGVVIICQGLERLALTLQPMTFRWAAKLDADPREIL